MVNSSIIAQCNTMNRRWQGSIEVCGISVPPMAAIFGRIPIVLFHVLCAFAYCNVWTYPMLLIKKERERQAIAERIGIWYLLMVSNNNSNLKILKYWLACRLPFNIAYWKQKFLRLSKEIQITSGSGGKMWRFDW